MEGPPSTSAATQTAMKARRAHDQHVPGPDPPDPDSLENSRDSADQQRRKDGPRYVAVRLLGDPGNDNNGQGHRRNDDHGGLNTGANGQ